MIYVTFKSVDYERFKRAIARVRRTVYAQADVVTRYMAIDYKNKVAQAIASNNFPFAVPGLSADYLAWKASHGFPTRIGTLKGDLLGSLTVLRGGQFTAANEKGWFGGVHPNAIGSSGKNWSLDGPAKLVIEYGTYLEKGTRGTPRRQAQPPRPIFKRMREYYIASGQMLQQGQKALRRVRSQWK